MLKVYKIRKKGTTDLFSSGGAGPQWTKKGKTWASMGHVSSHLGNHVDRKPSQYVADYADAEIVVYNVVEDQVFDIALAQKQIKDRRDAKVAKEKAAAAKMTEEQERAQLAALQQKYRQ
jgi:hypothetical protein